MSNVIDNFLIFVRYSLRG